MNVNSRAYKTEYHPHVFFSQKWVLYACIFVLERYILVLTFWSLAVKVWLYSKLPLPNVTKHRKAFLDQRSILPLKVGFHSPFTS